jgi:hypothetical protein
MVAKLCQNQSLAVILATISRLRMVIRVLLRLIKIVQNLTPGEENEILKTLKVGKLNGPRELIEKLVEVLHGNKTKTD